MTDPKPQSDDALVEAVLAGSEDAFVALVNRYQQRLVRLARSYVRDAAAAEDVVQETWIGLIRGLERFEGRSTFRTWLFRVLANRAKTRAVREARYLALEEHDQAGSPDDRFTPAGTWREPPRDWTVTPERLLLSDEIRTLIAQALDDLPPSQRTVVTLRDLEQLEAAEVCNVLGITETNQRVLLHRGRARIRAALAARLEPQ